MILAWVLARYTYSHHTRALELMYRTLDRCRCIWKGRQQQTLHSVILCHLISDPHLAAQGRSPAPTHPGNSERPWQRVGAEPTTSAPWKEDLGLRLLFGEFVHRSLQSLIYKPSLHGSLMHLMWVSCDCVHRCEYERLNEVCVPKRESARGYYNIFRANFILSLHAFR